MILFRRQALPQDDIPFLVEITPHILIISIICFVLYKLFCFFEMAYVEYVNKTLFYNHLYLQKKKLSNQQQSILGDHITFYNNLSLKDKSYFDHRVRKTLDRLEFIGKDIDVNDTMRLLISGTLVKLTFGLRDYKIGSVERIIFYPDEFYSQTNKAYHKGEFNPAYRALVFSWKDVLYGYEVGDDNLNLAVHEFIHAIHMYYRSVRRTSTSSAIFLDSFYELTKSIDADVILKENLVASQYIRPYAYTNQFEFLAVIVETFIETPKDFQSQFPRIYRQVKSMLNFNFKGY